MVLIPANMFRFGPYKKNYRERSLQNILFYKIVAGLFCRDFFKKQNILQRLFSTKWVQSSCVTYSNHHKSEVRDYFKKLV